MSRPFSVLASHSQPSHALLHGPLLSITEIQHQAQQTPAKNALIRTHVCSCTPLAETFVTYLLYTQTRCKTPCCNVEFTYHTPKAKIRQLTARSVSSTPRSQNSESKPKSTTANLPRLLLRWGETLVVGEGEEARLSQTSITVVITRGRWRGRAIGHKPQHARSTMPVSARRLESIVWEGHYPIPTIFPPGKQAFRIRGRGGVVKGGLTFQRMDTKFSLSKS